MFLHRSSSRTVVITLILIAFAAMAVNAGWGSGFGINRASTVKPRRAQNTDVQPPAAATNDSITIDAPPSLGNYTNKTVELSGNTIVTPAAAPANTTRMTVSASPSGFAGTLTADPVTGVVSVTNARNETVSAGTYTITVRAFGPGGEAAETFDLTVSSGTACSSNQRFSWPAVPEVSVSGISMGVAIGDFNGDGIQDFASTNDAPASSVSIRLGNGSGAFTSPVPDVPVGPAPHPIAVGDFNGDGFQDFATANQGTANNVSIRLGNGSGGFTAPPVSEIAVGAGPTSIAIADLNNDGNLDFAVTNLGAATISVRFGNGDGSFILPAVPEVPVGNSPTKVMAGDFNNDGMLDLATSNQWSHSVSIRIGNGSGQFTSANSEVAVGQGPMSLALGDFNGDGNQDFVTVNNGGAGLSIRLGNGSGGFISPAVPEIPLGTVASVAVAVGDFNNDGKQDIINGAGFFDNASIWLGDGNGGFTSSAMPYVYIGSNIDSIAVGDFNGDGVQDFLTSNRTTSNNPQHDISIRLGGCFPFTIGGKVLYGNAVNGGPSPNRLISYVLMTTSGSQTAGTITDPNVGIGGQYSLGVMGQGPLTVTPVKTRGVNGISSLDAAKISQHVIGVAPLTGNQLLAADVSGNGSISSFDAGEIANFVVHASTTGQTGTWNFIPESRAYSSITGSITGQDYVGVLLGELSGNWFDSSSRPVNRGSGGPQRNVSVSMPRTLSATGKDIILPVRVNGAAGKDIIAYEFELRYDPSVIQPQLTAVDLVGTVSSKLTAVTNVEEPGILRVAVYGPMPIDQNGVLLNLRFTPVGKPGSVSPLTWERIMFNEGEPGTTAVDGQVRLF